MSKDGDGFTAANTRAKNLSNQNNYYVRLAQNKMAETTTASECYGILYSSDCGLAGSVKLLLSIDLLDCSAFLCWLLCYNTRLDRRPEHGTPWHSALRLTTICRYTVCARVIVTLLRLAVLHSAGERGITYVHGELRSAFSRFPLRKQVIGV